MGLNDMLRLIYYFDWGWSLSLGLFFLWFGDWVILIIFVFLIRLWIVISHFIFLFMRLFPILVFDLSLLGIFWGFDYWKLYNFLLLNYHFFLLLLFFLFLFNLRFWTEYIDFFLSLLTHPMSWSESWLLFFGFQILTIFCLWFLFWGHHLIWGNHLRSL